MTQIIARLLKAFHMRQVMVFLVPLYTGTCLRGVTYITASLLKSCWKKGHFLLGTRLVCNTFLILFYELPVQKREEREREGRGLDNTKFNHLVELEVFQTLQMAPPAVTKQPISRKLLPSYNWLSTGWAVLCSLLCAGEPGLQSPETFQLKGSHCAC